MYFYVASAYVHTSKLSCMQGRMKRKNCRLTTKNLDYQLGWAILAECRQLDTSKRHFFFIFDINNQSTVPLLRSSLVVCKNTADQDSHHKNLGLTSKQKQYMKVGSKLYHCCK